MIRNPGYPREQPFTALTVLYLHRSIYRGLSAQPLSKTCSQIGIGTSATPALVHNTRPANVPIYVWIRMFEYSRYAQQNEIMIDWWLAPELGIYKEPTSRETW